MGEISEEVFKTFLARRERQVEKDRETQQIFDTFVQGGTDVLRKFIAPFVDFDHLKGSARHRAVKEDGVPVHIQDVTTPLMTLMGHEGASDGLEFWWWCLGRDRGGVAPGLTRNIQYKRRLVDATKMVLPSRAVVKETYDEMKALEGYCNAEFEKISKAWKLVGPEIAIDDDQVRMRTWYK